MPYAFYIYSRNLFSFYTYIIVFKTVFKFYSSRRIKKKKKKKLEQVPGRTRIPPASAIS